MSTQDASPAITIDDFGKVDIRSGTILQAEKIAKSDKLVKLQVDFGDLGTRTIVAGIGHSYMPESLVGHRVLAIVNLQPRTVFGVTSQGMILAAPSGSGASVLLAHCPGAPNGAKLG